MLTLFRNQLINLVAQLQELFPASTEKGNEYNRYAEWLLEDQKSGPTTLPEQSISYFMSPSVKWLLPTSEERKTRELTAQDYVKHIQLHWSKVPKLALTKELIQRTTADMKAQRDLAEFEIKARDAWKNEATHERHLDETSGKTAVIKNQALLATYTNAEGKKIPLIHRWILYTSIVMDALHRDLPTLSDTSVISVMWSLAEVLKACTAVQVFGDNISMFNQIFQKIHEQSDIHDPNLSKSIVQLILSDKEFYSVLENMCSTEEHMQVVFRLFGISPKIWDLKNKMNAAVKKGDHDAIEGVFEEMKEIGLAVPVQATEALGEMKRNKAPAAPAAVPAPVIPKAGDVDTLVAAPASAPVKAPALPLNLDKPVDKPESKAGVRVPPAAAVAEPTAAVVEPTAAVAEPTAAVAEPTATVAEPISQPTTPNRKPYQGFTFGK